MFDENLECQRCNWQGFESNLVCSQSDEKSNKAVSEIDFNLCPECGSDDICDIENEDN